MASIKIKKQNPFLLAQKKLQKPNPATPHKEKVVDNEPKIFGANRAYQISRKPKPVVEPPKKVEAPVAEVPATEPEAEKASWKEKRDSKKKLPYGIKEGNK